MQVITDGISLVPDLRAYDNYVMLLNREDISCSVIQLDNSHENIHCHFGYIPDTGLIAFTNAPC